MCETKTATLRRRHNCGFGRVRLCSSLLLAVFILSFLWLSDPIMQHTVRADVTRPYDWPMFRHNLQRTGYSTSPAPSTNQTLWTFTTGGFVISSPAVANGNVYVGSYDDKIYCLDDATGAHVWNYTTGGDVGSSPAVADGKVYISSVNNSKVYCFNAADGALIWSYTTGMWVYSSPVVANGVVYVGSLDRKIYAFSSSPPIPEGLTIGVMALLSTVAVIVSTRYFRKRHKPVPYV
jgi:hypothetical protein